MIELWILQCPTVISTVLYGESVTDTLVDYQMTHVTFGVSASPFAANMAVQQNTLNLAIELPK